MEKGQGLVEEYLNSLTQSNLKEKCLSKTIVELTCERDKLSSNILGLHLVVEHHHEKKKKWMKTCEDMTHCVHHHVTNLAAQF